MEKMRAGARLALLPACPPCLPAVCHSLFPAPYCCCCCSRCALLRRRGSKGARQMWCATARRRRAPHTPSLTPAQHTLLTPTTCRGGGGGRAAGGPGREGGGAQGGLGGLNVALAAVQRAGGKVPSRLRLAPTHPPTQPHPPTLTPSLRATGRDCLRRRHQKHAQGARGRGGGILDHRFFSVCQRCANSTRQQLLPRATNSWLTPRCAPHRPPLTAGPVCPGGGWRQRARGAHTARGGGGACGGRRGHGAGWL